jgi:hypothetical protein
METCIVTHQERAQKPTICRKADANSFFETHKASTGTFQERGTTMNSAHYSEMFTDRLKPATQSKS